MKKLKKVKGWTGGRDFTISARKACQAKAEALNAIIKLHNVLVSSFHELAQAGQEPPLLRSICLDFRDLVDHVAGILELGPVEEYE